MDQFLVAMTAVIAFGIFAVRYAFRSDRKSSDGYEPSEHGESPL